MMLPDLSHLSDDISLVCVREQMNVQLITGTGEEGAGYSVGVCLVALLRKSTPPDQGLHPSALTATRE